MGRRVAYIDCFSGASGDMLLAAWLDAGLALDDLREDLAALDLGAHELRLERQLRHGIAGSRFEVLDHSDSRPAHNLAAIRGLIEKSALPAEVAEPSLRVFQRLAEAEAQVHAVPVDEIHFHEVGALDTVVDIVGFCCALRRLGIAALYASALPVGTGAVRTAHGLLPVPAPATLALLAQAQAPVLSPEAGPPARARAELLTPTGAALLTTLAEFRRPTMRVQRVGYGFGAKELPWPNTLRAWIGETTDETVPLPQAPQIHEHAV